MNQPTMFFGFSEERFVELIGKLLDEKLAPLLKPEYLTQKEIKKRYGISGWVIRKRVKEGVLKENRKMGFPKYLKTDIENLINHKP